jgi:hypothetical protein
LDTTFDQARRCPICDEPGKEKGTRPGPRGSTFHEIVCVNSRCRWFGSDPYIIQVRADGTIPEPTLDRQKSFPKVADRTDAVQANLERLYQQTTTPGSETR